VAVFGITGSIATGKTAFTQAIQRALPAEVFDADACARVLVSCDESVRDAIRQQFGGSVFSSEGELLRQKLRNIVFQDETQRRALETILHPAIRRTWLERVQKIRQESGWLFVDIPLLFETAAEKLFDAVIVVACSGAIQRQRLVEIRNLPIAIAEKIIAAQMPLSEKITRADYLIWNDGDLSFLEQQTTFLSHHLKLRHA
jgi:dephospho-CoA kinase